jgi:2-phospho-L-lactate guanylyltransferase
VSATWTALIPVKAWTRAKSRLEASALARAEFARAVALDTLDTVAASRLIGRIVIVSSEPELADIATQVTSAVVLDEPQGESPDRLNEAIRWARDWAAGHAPTSPTVVIPADLPALTTASLDEALQQLAWLDRAHVPDHRGRGTTLSAAVRPDLLTPRYGPNSERAHASVGSIPILHVAYGVRLDVDDREDLARAAALGLGPRTRGVVLVTGSERPGAVASPQRL